MDQSKSAEEIFNDISETVKRKSITSDLSTYNPANNSVEREREREREIERETKCQTLLNF